MAQEGILYKDIRFPPKKIDFPSLYSNILTIKASPSYDADTEYMVAYYHFRYADFFLENQRKDAAKDELQKAIEIGNDNTLVLTNTAKYLGELDEVDEVIKIYEKLVSKNSANDTVHFNLGILLEGKGKNKEAIREYRNAIEKNPKYLQAILQLANLLEKEKQYKEMLEQYMNLENIHYETEYTIEKILYAAVHTQECQVAEMFYPKLNVTANFKVFANNIGICFAQKKEFDKAKNWWEKALEIDKNYDVARENLTRLESLPHP